MTTTGGPDTEVDREQDPGGQAGEPGPASTRRERRWPEPSWEGAVTALVVACCVTFVFVSLDPKLIFTENTPTGGDMGSHVWGPMTLMREILPHGRLTGWTPDWYAGFPAFQFYMVVPMLAIVVLHVGVRSPLILLSLPAALALMPLGWVVGRLARFRWALFGLGAFLTLLVLPVPYGVSFKLVAISGMLGLPVAAWALGRLAGAPFPIPPALALGSLFFLYNLEPTLNSGTGNIIGGNLTSTMAGEFSFSISLTLGLLYLGFLIRGLRTGRGRATTAVLLALCGLCHIIPAFYVLVATALALVIWPGRARLRWFIPVGPVAGLLAAFWVVPFATRHAYVNDMGWEPLPHANADPHQDLWSYLRPDALTWPLLLAVGGLVVGLVFRQRLALLLGGLMAAGAAGFAWVPDGRLWNARVLPLYYLAMFLLAALGVAVVLRAVAVLVSPDPYHPLPWVGIAAAAPAVVATVVFLGGPLGVMPGHVDRADGKPEWMGIVRDHRNPGAGWAKYNFRGLEGQLPVQKDPPDPAVPNGQGGWPEFRDMVATMQSLGDDPEHGCGRAFWEFGSERLTTYGTTMAPMMLPYFTDGCIGSMEGLYFESSATTPYHFLAQCQLSQRGSCSQRDLPYTSFDLDRGLDKLELLGVRYYMAFSDTAVQAASGSNRLTEVAVSGPWHVYELDPEATQLVVGLANEPVVLEGVDPTQDGWLDVASAWFNDRGRWDVPFTLDGPESWTRVEVPAVPYETPGADGEEATRRRYGDRDLPSFPAEGVRPALVSDVRTGDETLSFRVDRPGTPVLVKVSYFPNWEASGAEGPWRVSPNLMVVVPTSEEVTLHYGRTGVDWAGYLLTLLGLLAVAGLWRLGPVAVPEGRADRRHRLREEERVRLAAAAAAETWLAGQPATVPWYEPPPDRDPPGRDTGSVVPWGPTVTWTDPAPPDDARDAPEGATDVPEDGTEPPDRGSEEG